MSDPTDHLRRRAKALLKSARSGDSQALARIRAQGPEADPPRHADALHAIAREEGYPSWPQLKLAHQAAAMDRAERAERLKLALYPGRNWEVDRLLAADPDLGRDNLGLMVALYDCDGVEAALAANPSAATRLVGVRSPMLHLAFSRHIHAASGKRDDMLAVAAALVAAGADVNDSYPWQPDSDHRLSAPRQQPGADRVAARARRRSQRQRIALSRDRARPPRRAEAAARPWGAAAGDQCPAPTEVRAPMGDRTHEKPGKPNAALAARQAAAQRLASRTVMKRILLDEAA